MLVAATIAITAIRVAVQMLDLSQDNVLQAMHNYNWKTKKGKKIRLDFESFDMCRAANSDIKENK